MRKKALFITVILIVIACAVLLFACKPAEYTVTFDLQGGTMESESLTAEEGKALDLSAYVPAREGYIFLGWYDENESRVTLTVINSNVTFYARWQAADNAVTYYVNGEEYFVQSALTGESVDPIEYEFDGSGEFFGWFSDRAMTQRIGASVTVAPGGTALYGAFIGDEYVSATFNLHFSGSEVIISNAKDASLSAVYIPSTYGNYTVRVGEEAFRNISSLKTVYLGASVVVQGGAFAGSGVESVICSGNYRINNGALYSGNALVFVLASTAGDYVVSEFTTDIYAFAFAGNKALTSVTLPANLQSAGSRIFADCADNLQVILHVKAGAGYDPYWNFKGYSGTEQYQPSFITDGEENGYVYAIRGGNAYIVDYQGGETDVVLPAALGGHPVKGVEVRAFIGTNIISVTVPDGIDYVASEAFAYCENLLTVVFEGANTTIGDWAFSGCEQLAEVTLPSSLKTLSAGAFAECINLKSISLPQTLTAIGMDAFNGTGIKEITIPASVTEIGARAFDSTGSGEEAALPIVITVKEGAAFDWDEIITIGRYEIIYA